MLVCRSTFKIQFALLAAFAVVVAGCDSRDDAGIVSMDDALAFAGESEIEQPASERATETKQADKESGDENRVAEKNNDAGPQPMLEHPFPRHVPAPALEGGVEWINAAGPVDLKDLRGKFVLLDFWTYCCINCMHVLPELKKLEHKYPNNLVVIGVHSAKFETEEDSDSIRQAVMRYEIEHPVVNDANHKIWQRYMCESWPSLRMIDPEGNLVAMNSGEIQADVLDEFMKHALPYYRQRKLLDERPVHFDLEHRKAAQTPLRFPGKILADEKGGRLFISDSNHNRIVVSSLDGKLLQTIGSGELGRADGDFKTAQFNRPQGMALKGDMLYVADTENHLLRKADLKTQKVETIAGTGAQSQESWGGVPFDVLRMKIPDRFVGPPKQTALSSPWALWIHDKDLYIAMAGTHQIWKMPLDESEIGPYAGNGREDIVDGALLPSQPYELGFSSFAQPSGLTADDDWLYVADSEGSSVRAVPFDPKGRVKTVIGTSHLGGARLFTFGDVDGQGEAAKLQHCLGVAYHDGKIYVADTYNHKIKVIDVKTKECRTLAGTGKPGHDDNEDGLKATFFEPEGLAYGGEKLYVADTNNHLIRAIDLKHQAAVSTLNIAELAPPQPPQSDRLAAPKKPNFDDAKQIAVEQLDLKPNEQEKIYLNVKLNLPKGYKINPLAPMRYFVEVEGESGPIDRTATGTLVSLAKPATDFQVPLPIKAAAARDSSADTLKLSFRYYYCQEGAEGLCKIGSVSFTVPVKIAAGAKSSEADLRLNVE